MSKKRLSNLAVISIEHKITGSIELTKIKDELVSLKARRVVLKTGAFILL